MIQKILIFTIILSISLAVIICLISRSLTVEKDKTIEKTAEVQPNRPVVKEIKILVVAEKNPESTLPQKKTIDEINGSSNLCKGSGYYGQPSYCSRH